MATNDPYDHRTFPEGPESRREVHVPVHTEGDGSGWRPITDLVDVERRVNAYQQHGYYSRVEVDRDIRRRTTVVHCQFEVPYDVLERNDQTARALDILLRNDCISGADKLRAIAQFMERLNDEEAKNDALEPACFEEAHQRILERDAIAATMNREDARALDLGEDEEEEPIGRSDKAYPALGPA